MTESPSITMKLTPHLLMEQIHLHGWNWMSAGAAFGLCFGILSPLAGSMITAIRGSQVHIGMGSSFSAMAPCCFS